MQRAGETGQLLPTITPFNGVQQDPMGYDGLPTLNPIRGDALPGLASGDGLPV